jgi:hypothetical protein
MAWIPPNISWIAGNVVSSADLNRIEGNIDHLNGSITDHINNQSTPHGATSAATANKLIIRDSAGRGKIAAPSANDDIARKDTFFGSSDGDIGYLYRLILPGDTRNFQATSWDINNNPTMINIRNGGTVIATIALTWDSGKLLTALVTQGTFVRRYTFDWDGDKFLGYSKAVT